MPAGAMVRVRNDGITPYLNALIEGGTDTSLDRVMQIASGSAIMVCHGRDKCIYSFSCPFCTGAIKGQNPPVSEHCPLEVVYFFQFYEGYREEICPDGKNFSTMSIIKDMCVLELNLMRTERLLSTDGAMVEVAPVGVDKATGEIMYRNEMAAKAHTWRILLKEKIKLLEQMGLTPASRAKIGSTAHKDPSTFAAELLTFFRTVYQDRQRAAAKETYDARAEKPQILPAGDIIDVEPESGEQPGLDSGGITESPGRDEEARSESPVQEDDEPRQRNYGSAAPW